MARISLDSELRLWNNRRHRRKFLAAGNPEKSIFYAEDAIPVTITDYRNFDLLITRAGDRYRAFVVDAPEGEASVLFHLAQVNQ